METVLILGGKSDIAIAIAHEFAKKKHTIILAAREVHSLDSTRSDLQIRYKGIVHLCEFDASDFDSHSAFYQMLPASPTIVISVFGYLGSQPKAEKNWQETKNIIDINFTGAVSILNIAAADMENKKSGCIIGISSVAGDRGRQSNFIYGSAKAGFTAYLSGLRNRLYKHNVHVVTIKPGFVRTKMTAGMPLPGPITATPQQVGLSVYNSFAKKTDVLYVLWMWRYIMLIIRSIPESIFKKLKL